MGFPKFIGRLLKSSRAVTPATQTVIPAVKTAESLPAVVKPITVAEPVVSTVKPVVQAYQIQHLPGYQLKSLMSGNPLEKQLSKTGTISTASVDALAKKMSAVEQAVIGKVLAEKFPGQKAVDYNDFRKGVQDELITYDRTPSSRYEDYGFSRLGFDSNVDYTMPDIDAPEVETMLDFIKSTNSNWRTNRRYGKPIFVDSSNRPIPKSDIDTQYVKWLKDNDIPIIPKTVPTANTYTFSSLRIPTGSGKHYDPNTLGHSRTYTTLDEPDVLHVMESQSDWAQSGKVPDRYPSAIKHEESEVARMQGNVLNAEKAFKDAYGIDAPSFNPNYTAQPAGWSYQQWLDYNTIDTYRYYLKNIQKELQRFQKLDHQGLTEEYLMNNYPLRQLQENLKFAAEKGQTKMRYPTRETAAKIEDYPAAEEPNLRELSDAAVISLQGQKPTPYTQELFDLRSKLQVGIENDILPKEDIQKLSSQIKKIEGLENMWKSGETTYSSKLETILGRYSDFPKQFGKLFKGSDVRLITDPKNNTWYEVDVPKDYLQMEWPYKDGGNIPSVFKEGGIIKAQPGVGKAAAKVMAKAVKNTSKTSKTVSVNKPSIVNGRNTKLEMAMRMRENEENDTWNANMLSGTANKNFNLSSFLDRTYDGRYVVSPTESFLRRNMGGATRKQFILSNPVTSLDTPTLPAPTLEDELKNAGRDFAIKYQSDFSKNFKKALEYNSVSAPILGYTTGTILGPHWWSGNIKVAHNPEDTSVLANIVENHEAGHATGNMDENYIYNYLIEKGIIDKTKAGSYFLDADRGEISAHLSELPDYLGFTGYEDGHYTGHPFGKSTITSTDIYNYNAWQHKNGFKHTIFDAINKGKMKAFVKFMNDHPFALTLPVAGIGLSTVATQKEENDRSIKSIF